MRRGSLTVEVLVILAESFNGLLCLVDLSLDAVSLGDVVATLFLPSLRLRLLFGDPFLPLFQRLVKLALSLFHLSVGCLGLR